jgi:outer membrane lipoprotein carrier protein
MSRRLNSFSAITLLAVASFLVSAQTKRQLSQTDSVIVTIHSHYSRIDGLAADFEQIYSLPGQAPRHETGRLFLARPRLMRWEYDSNKLFVVNDREVWWYVPADREATHADVRSVNDSRLPFLFLLGKPDFQRNFTGIELVTRDNQEVGQQTMRLRPKRSDTGIKEILLTCDSNGAISQVRLSEESGGTSQIFLRNVRENFQSPAAAFTFVPPPGVRIRRQG